MTIMQKSKNLVRNFIADESGLAAVEYGLLAAGIAIGLWALISSMGGSLQTIYENVGADLVSGAAKTS